MGPRHTRPLSIVTLLVALTGAGACSSATQPVDGRAPSGAAATVSIPTPASATPSTSTAVFDVLANMPAAAKEHTTQGAEAFAKYFFEASSKVIETPSPGQFSRLCIPDAPACAGRERKVSTFVAAGHRLASPELSAPEASRIPYTPMPEKYAYVTVLINQLASRKLDRQGGDAGENTAAKTYGADLQITWEGGSWKAMKVGDPEKTRMEPQQ